MSSLDYEVISALYEAVSESGQLDKVAKRIEAWLNAMSTSELSASDEQDYLENVRSAITVNVTGDLHEN
ncbi:CxC ATPase DNA modification system associated small protein [Leptolyngbya sp. KIOST-1]|uniref:CxC ATPase DNA modification system associated small protein n=1 Tax=Leptolyngbya sp. KIOST-1 TaxID=1229172 RepID=UPI0012E015EA|nr:CxC ATPase DNA modification system associated small protein [Leptolyngbya sp. KIOST-1]